MRRSLATGSVLLALGARTAALTRHELAPTAGYGLAPSADFELAPIEPGEELPSRQGVTPEHSHSVLKKLVSADAWKEIEQREMLDDQLDPRAQDETGKLLDVPTQQPQTEDRLQAPPGQVGLCAGTPIFYGPTLGWEDCRKRCIGHCRFWSFWHGSVQHRCKLTMDCNRRERDGHGNVSASRRALDTANEEDVKEQAAWDNGMTPLDPEPEQAAPQQAGPPPRAPEAKQTACSTQGSARKFATNPHSGWHNLGKLRSYDSCAKTSWSMGYGNLVWNVGSIGKGRCYGFSSDMPDVLEHNCEDTYCWLFGPASPACQGQNLTYGEVERILEVEPQSTTVESAGAEVRDEHNETLAEGLTQKPKGVNQKIKDFFHIR